MSSIQEVKDSPDLPLTGIRVLEIGSHTAGAMCGMLLADQGADVVKIENPNSAAPRDAVDDMLDRGKCRIALDLKDNTSLAKINELVTKADILIENMRPGSMSKLSLGWETVHTANPKLIYVSLPGFSEADPERRDIAAWEGVLSAACGVFTDINMARRLLERSPTYSALPHVSAYGAINGAISAVTAPLQRELSGCGERIEVPLIAAGLSAFGTFTTKIEKQPNIYDMPPIPRPLRDKVIPKMIGFLDVAPPCAEGLVLNRMEKVYPPLIGSYPCADGRLIYLFANEHEKLPLRVLKTFDLWEGLQKKGIVNTSPFETDKLGYNLADSSSLQKKHQRWIRKKLRSIFRRNTAEYWEQRLNQAGIPASVQRSSKEWLSLSAPQTSGLTITSSTGDKQLGPQFWIDGVSRDHLPVQPPKSIGEEEIEQLWLDNLCSSTEENTEKSKVCNAPLEGLRVLDLCSMIAGPSAGGLLARLGAEVTKIDPPNPRHGPRCTIWLAADINCGKRSLLLDLLSPEGLAVFDKMLKKADVVLHNNTTKAAERLGLQKARLHSINPQLVVCKISAYEGPFDGPFNGRHGYDPVVQAATGVMLRYGSPQAPEMHGLASCVDYMSGYSAAFGIVSALWYRSRHNQGSLVRTSLAQAAQFIQAPFMNSRSDRDRTGRSETLGSSETDRLYKTRDGWVFLAAPKRTPEEIKNILSPNKPTDTLEKLVAGYTSDKLCVELGTYRDVGCCPVSNLDSIMSCSPVLTVGSEAQFEAGTSVLRYHHNELGEVRLLAAADSRWKSRRIPVLPFSPKHGSHSRELMLEFGIASDHMEKLINTGVVSTALAKEYLPAPPAKNLKSGATKMTKATPRMSFSKGLGRKDGRPTELDKLKVRFPEKRAFITGAAHGLGRALALELASGGWALGLCDLDRSALDGTAEDVRAAGGSAACYVFDVANETSMQDAVKEFSKDQNGLDLMFNNAGAGDGGLFSSFDMGRWRRLIDVNLLGVVYGTHAALEIMARQNRGHIVNIASAAAFHGLPGLSAYNATKAGVMALTETIYTEIEHTNVDISVQICTMWKSDNFASASTSNKNLDEKEREVIERMTETAPITDVDAARYTLNRLLDRDLYIVIPTDAPKLAMVKRLSPRLYLKFKRFVARRAGILPDEG